MEVRNRIKHIAKERGITLTEMETLTGVNRTTLLALSRNPCQMLNAPTIRQLYASLGIETPLLEIEDTQGKIHLLCAIPEEIANSIMEIAKQYQVK